MTKAILPALREFMQTLVHGAGAPHIEEDQGVRRLRFDGTAVQSSMRLADPYALELSYTRAMMAFVLFNPEPRHILAAGLGGGSLPKFCHRELPAARITALEINPEVIALRDEFLIPPDGERFRVVQADAGEYLARDGVEADVILVDGYDRFGLPERLCTESFYADCWRTLTPDGVLVVNLWGNEPNRGLYLERLIRVFGGRVWWCRPRDSSCLIAYGRKRDCGPPWSRMIAQARALDARHRLELVHAVFQMRERADPYS